MTSASAERCDAISVGDADAALAMLASFDTILLAVSGGSDSMALLELVAEWRGRRRSLTALSVPQVFVATVDHGLRPESADEACFVAARCTALGLPHTTLLWSGSKSRNGLANHAREARYRLLQAHLDALVTKGLCAVVTAHTRDDQAETVLMRLARGSGCEGLSAMAPSRPITEGSSVQLLRPLLDFTKLRLAATLAERRLSWREDSSNGDDRFERVRVRRAMPTLAGIGLTSVALTRSARRMQATSDALKYADQAFVESIGLSFNDEVFASFDGAPFAMAPSLLRARLMARLIRRFGGETAAPDLQDVEYLIQELANATQTRMILGGVVISKGQRRVRLWREPGRISTREHFIPHGSWSLWDGRFWLKRSGARTDVAVSVRPLGAGGYLQLAKLLRLDKYGAPAGAVQALPAFYSGETLISVPGLTDRSAMFGNTTDFTGIELTAKAALDAHWVD